MCVLKKLVNFYGCISSGRRKVKTSLRELNPNRAKELSRSARCCISHFEGVYGCLCTVLTHCNKGPLALEVLQKQ